MSSTKWSSELRDLFKGTQARFPHQKLDPESIKVLLEDWRDWLSEVGWPRFEIGVKRARTTTDFFPSINLIKKLTPEAQMQGSFNRAEFEDLKRRAAAGEKFYTLGDALLEFSKQVIAGKIKGRDERGQKALEDWAKMLNKSYKEYAVKMLGDTEKKRPKSDFVSVSEMTKTK